LSEQVEALHIVQAEKMQRFASLLQTHYHMHFHHELLKIKHAYTPFNPDSDTITLKEYTPTQLDHMEKKFLSHIIPLLEHANYEQLTQENIHKAIEETSPYGVEVSVNFDEFEKFFLFFRGSAIKKEHKRRLKTLFLQKREVQTKVYRRLFLLVKQQVNGKTVLYMKLFKDIPQSDLEMLFPNIKIKIALFDKIKLLITGGGGTIAGTMTLLGKLAVALEPMALLSAIGAFGALIGRQVMSIFNHRTKYTAQLTKNLYFYNLNNNLGTVTHMLDTAEEEESKEALLAYFFLLKAGTTMTKEELDTHIETFIQSTFHIPMDFEIDDAISKLVHLKLVQRDSETLQALRVDDALHILETTMPQTQQVT
jgi:hypothetical protein